MWINHATRWLSLLEHVEAIRHSASNSIILPADPFFAVFWKLQLFIEAMSLKLTQFVPLTGCFPRPAFSGEGERSFLRHHRLSRTMGMSNSAQKKSASASEKAPGKIDYSSISNEEWKKQLSREQYEIARKKGTERAFTGEYWNTKTPGIYHCVCCDIPLFDSDTKFDSGTGWPSYFEQIGNNVKTKVDFSIIFMPRQEVLCATCDAHLGHVFDDGPPPSGKRYCINSASLKMKPK